MGRAGAAPVFFGLLGVETGRSQLWKALPQDLD